jgi:amino-acid N-acetyltransferase
MVRERPPQLSVVALLEAEGLPASDLSETHLEHFFITGSDGAPSALVGLEIYGEVALLRSLVVSAAARTQGLVLRRRPPSNPRASSRAFARRAPPS